MEHHRKSHSIARQLSNWPRFGWYPKRQRLPLEVRSADKLDDSATAHEPEDISRSNSGCRRERFGAVSTVPIGEPQELLK
eukprot:s529_g13.t1